MEINVELHVAHWIGTAKEDLLAAESLLQKRLSVQAAFFAELAVEKALKALVVARTRTIPPFTHDLLRLSALTGLHMPPDRLRRLAAMQRYAIEGRYPDVLKKKIPLEEVSDLLRQAKEEVEWLSNQL